MNNKIKKVSNQDQRLIISDLDGTLLNAKGELTAKTIAVVKKLVETGHIFCISTGRPYRSAIKFYRELGLTTIMSNINGAYLINPNDNLFFPISNVFSRNILFAILENKIVYSKMTHVYVENLQGGIIFKKHKNTIVSQDVVELFHVDVKDIIEISVDETSQWNLVKYDLYSILINIEEKDLDEVSFAIKSHTTTLFVDYWKNAKAPGIVTLEIRTLFQNKGSSLKFIACYYGIPFRNVLAFGDGKNDIDMMKITTRSYAMKNGEYAVKMESYKITEHTNDDDGVAHELTKLLLK